MGIVESLGAPGLAGGSRAAAQTDRTGQDILRALSGLGNLALTQSFEVDRQHNMARRELRQVIEKSEPLIDAAVEQGIKPELQSEALIAQYDRSSALSSAQDDIVEFHRRINLPADHEDSIAIDVQPGQTRAEAAKDALRAYLSDRVPDEWSADAKAAYTNSFYTKAKAVITTHFQEQDRILIQDSIDRSRASAEAAESPEQLQSVIDTAVAAGAAIGKTPAQSTLEVIGSPARAAALAGNFAELEKYREHMEQFAPSTWEALLATADAQAAKIESERLDRNNKLVRRSLARGDASELTRDLNEQMFKNGEITAEMKLANETAIERDIFRRDREAHDSFFNNAKIVLKRGQFNPEVIEDRIRKLEDGELGETKRLSSEEADELRRIVGRRVKFDGDRVFVQQSLAREGGSPVPLSNDKMDAWLSVMADQGIAEVTTVDGELSYLGISKPELAAGQAAKMQRVHPKWADQTAQSMSTAQSADQLELAARSYASLHLSNRHLAAQVYEKMSTKGKVRADFIRRELERERPPAVAPSLQNGQPEPNQAWVDHVKDVSGRAMGLEPVDLTTEQASAILWEGANVDTAVIDTINESLPAGMEDNFAFGFGRSEPVVSRAAMNTYQKMAEEELRVQMSRGLNDRDARAAAVKVATDQFLAKFPPVMWNDTTYLGNPGPHAFTPSLEEQMDKAIEGDVKENRLTSSLSFYKENYRPVWNPDLVVQQRGVRQLGAWQLIDNVGTPLRRGDGSLVSFLPDVEETKPKTRQQIEATGRAAAQERRDSAKRMDDALFMIGRYAGQ